MAFLMPTYRTSSDFRAYDSSPLLWLAVTHFNEKHDRHDDGMRTENMKTFPLLSIVTACSTSTVVAQVENGNRPAPADQSATVGTARPGGTMLAPSLPDGFTVMNGFVYSIRAGVMAPLQGELIVRVSPNGTITGFDGRTYALPQGRVLTLFASTTPIPVGTAGATTVNQPSAPAESAQPSNSPGAPAAASATTGGTGFNTGVNMNTDYPFFIVSHRRQWFSDQGGAGNRCAKGDRN